MFTCYIHIDLQLGFVLALLTLDQRPAIGKHRLAAVHTHNKPHLVESLAVLVAHLPHVENKLVTRLDRCRKSRLELLEILGLASAKRLEHGVRSHVPGEQTVDNGAAEAHFLAGLRVCMKRVVVAVEAVQMGGFQRGLEGVRLVGLA